MVTTMMVVLVINSYYAFATRQALCFQTVSFVRSFVVLSDQMLSPRFLINGLNSFVKLTGNIHQLLLMTRLGFGGQGSRLQQAIEVKSCERHYNMAALSPRALVTGALPLLLLMIMMMTLMMMRYSSDGLQCFRLRSLPETGPRSGLDPIQQTSSELW